MAFSFQATRSETEAIRIEDDGRVCYAYFIAEGEVDGFVWLYNIADPPSTLEEQRGTAAPLNPQIHSSAMVFMPPNSEGDFDFNWVFREGVWECGIYIRDRIHAVLGRGDHPGWCVLASHGGPLANSLEAPPAD